MTHFNMNNEGVIMRNDRYEIIVKYDPKLWLLERYFEDKVSTHWPETPRVLEFVLAKFILIRKGYLNTASAFQHWVLLNWMESRELNILVLLIHYIKQHRYSRGSLIIKILSICGVNLTGAK